jgi:glycosyltransferase involved in cell wall biosynthesis
MDKPLISVIMPVYNVESYLSKAIESVLKQTYKRLELLLIDDGSTDKSGFICDEYAGKDNRIRVFHKKNEGQAEARNVGLNNASGVWILFLDSDDWIEPEMLEILHDIAEENGSKISACKTQYFQDEYYDEKNDTNCVYNYTISQVLNLLLNKNVIRFELWNKLWHRDVIGDVRFKMGQISEEVFFDFEVFKKVDRITYIDTSLHHYLINREGNTKSKFRIERMCIFDEFKSYIRYLNVNNYQKDAEVVSCIASMFCISIYLEAKDTNQEKKLCDRLRELFLHFVKSSGRAKKYKWKAILLFCLSPKIYAYLLKKRLGNEK